MNKKIIIIIAGLAVAMIAGTAMLIALISNLVSGGSSVGFGDCAVCAKIAELNNERAEKYVYLEENRTSMGMIDETYALRDIETVELQLQMLGEHDCSKSVKKVEDMEFNYKNYAGTYTGECRSGIPCGEGTFTGVYKLNNAVVYEYEYSGEWSGATPNGNGEYEDYYNNDFGFVYKYYSGGIKNGVRDGDGYYYFKNQYFSRECINGTYENDVLIGQSDFIEYDEYGEMSDRGVVEGDEFTVVASERREYEKQQQELQNQQIQQWQDDLFASIGNSIIDGLGDYLAGDSGGSYYSGGSGGGSSYAYSEPAVDNSAAIEEFESLAIYWEDEYYRLLQDDPQCLNYQTKDAEYNMNYFRRRARELY